MFLKYINLIVVVNLKQFFHEVSAGLALFLSVFYIFILLPQIYSEAGVPVEQSVIAIALVVAFSTLLAGFFIRIPVVIAPGVSIASYVVFTLVLDKGFSWPVVLAAIFLEGVLFFALSISKLRQWFAIGIPNAFKYGILAGVGLFLAFLGFKNSFMFDFYSFPFLSFYNIHAIITIAGLVFGLALVIKRIPGAFFLTILFTTILAVFAGLFHFPSSYFSFPSFSFPSLDFKGLSEAGFLSVVLSLFMVDFFDGLGAGTSLLMRMGKLDKKGHIKGLDRVMISDSLTTMFSSLFGATTSVVMLESGVAIEEKTKTLIPSIVVAILSLLVIFFSPLISSFSIFLASPVIIILGLLCFSAIKMENFKKLDDLLPALITTITIPLTMSISTGIGLGAIVYVLLKLLLGKYDEIAPAMAIISLLFSLDYLYVF